jgi:urease accessory protein UreF
LQLPWQFRFQSVFFESTIPTQHDHATRGQETVSAPPPSRKIFNCSKALLSLANGHEQKHDLTSDCGTEAAVIGPMNPWVKPELSHDAAEWLGDAHPLVAQLGSADGLVSLHTVADSLTARPITNFVALREFLHLYQERILLPHELPVIRDARQHAANNHVRELVALDQQLSNEPALRDFAAASRRVGRAQLQRLRPLRDERIVQRYLQAVEDDGAHGWHTLVYGLTLAVYSLPVRQGLLGYAHQTTGGFIHAAARSLHATEADCRALFEELCEPLPAAVEGLIGSCETTAVK